MLEAKSVVSRALPRVDLTCGPGLHTVVASEIAAASELVAIASGLARPRRGTLRVGGKDPYRSPETRRAIATLLYDEQAVQGRSVEESLGRALALHQSPLKAADVLSPFGLSVLAARPPGSLCRAELRAVALALALSLEPVSLLVLHEPLATSLDRARVRLPCWSSPRAIAKRVPSAAACTRSRTQASSLGIRSVGRRMAPSSSWRASRIRSASRRRCRPIRRLPSSSARGGRTASPSPERTPAHCR